MSGRASTRKIGNYTEGHLLKRACAMVEKKAAETTIFDANADKRIPKFESSELTIGRVLGRGGFCVVSEVTKITLKDSPAQKVQSGRVDDNDDEDRGQTVNFVQDRKFMEAYCIRDRKDARYAIKRLAEDCLKDPQLYINGVVDLAIEARFLAVIRHPNIIKMRAVEAGTPYSMNFFVILDRLYDILSKRVVTWKKRRVGGMMDRKGKKKAAHWLERVTCAHDLACALKYLHSVSVTYRDLKPDNIGFDVRGDVKIFDFGLAKEFDRDKVDENGCYKLTGDTGSPRYMAPEVALGKPYNESVDAYSFGILLWHILAMEVPFEGYNMSMFKKRVVLGGSRPKPDPKWPEEVSSLMKRCWSVDHTERPSMEDIVDVLRDEISKYTDEEVQEILDVSRKSEMSLHFR